MRQAGFLAAAGLYALHHHVERLQEDHRRAQVLGALIGTLPFVHQVLPVYTNIVIFHLDPKKMSGTSFEKQMKERGIRVSSFGKQTIRLVTHLDFTEKMLEQTIEALQKDFKTES